MAFFEESNPCDIEFDDLLFALKKHFKRVQKDDLRFFYHGTYNVFEFNQYILRVPDASLRNDKGVELIQDEVMKLKNLAEFLNVAIPQPLILSLEEEMPFMIYEKLSGIPLSSAYSSLNSQNKKKIALGIADFLNTLHSPALLHQVNSKMFLTNFQVADYKQYWMSRYEEIQEKTFPLLNSTQQYWTRNIFESFLGNRNNFLFKPVVTHCDFDMTNILIHPEKGLITGIVDFETTKAWDPAADLLFYTDPKFQEKILGAYQFNSSESLQERMKFLYCRTWAPYIDTGLKIHNPRMVKFGLIKLDTLMHQFPL